MEKSKLLFSGIVISAIPDYTKVGLEKMTRRKKMRDVIDTPRISEILREEFMEPLGISAYKLAASIHVPVSRIQDILHDRRKITVDTSIRLGLFFGVSEKYFLDMQNDIDIRNAKKDHKDDLEQIETIRYAG